jgi:hypothetical protein
LDWFIGGFMYNTNRRPLSFAPPGGFPTQRIADFGGEIDPVKYIKAPVSAPLTEEHEFASSVNRARMRLASGESRHGQRNVSIGEREVELKKAQIELPESGVGGYAGTRSMHRLSKYMTLPIGRFRRR